jgi:hypothetical protein
MNFAQLDSDNMVLQVARVDDPTIVTYEDGVVFMTNLFGGIWVPSHPEEFVIEDDKSVIPNPSKFAIIGDKHDFETGFFSR